MAALQSVFNLFFAIISFYIYTDANVDRLGERREDAQYINYFLQMVYSLAIQQRTQKQTLPCLIRTLTAVRGCSLSKDLLGEKKNNVRAILKTSEAFAKEIFPQVFFHCCV